MGELERIRTNVLHLMQANAPEADIQEYLKSEGYTLSSLNEALQAPRESQPQKPSAGGLVADAMVALGNAAALGLPAALSTDTSNYLDAAVQRSPRTARTAAIAGSLLPALATSGGALGLTAGARALAPLRVTGASLAKKGASALAGAGRAAMANPLVNNPLTRTAGALGTWEALKKIRDIFGGNSR